MKPMAEHPYQRAAIASIATAFTLVALSLAFGRPHGLLMNVLFGLTAETVGRCANPVLQRLRGPWKARGCLVFDWGPPWQTRPRFERSNYHAGWSIVWLYLGIRYIPVGASKLMLDGAYPRCRRCQQHHPLKDLTPVPTTNGSEPMMCRECLAESKDAPRQ